MLLKISQISLYTSSYITHRDSKYKIKLINILFSCNKIILNQVYTNCTLVVGLNECDDKYTVLFVN